MKKRLIYSCLLAGATLIAGCTKNFDAINTNPTKVNAEVFPPNFLLAQSQIKFSNSGYDQLLFQSMWSQSLACTYDYYGNGDKYVYAGSGRGYLERTWNTSYGAATLVDEMKNLIKGKAEFTNLDNVGTIMRMLILQRITDAYGDIPFSQEGQAKAGIVNPVFDTQQSIYTSMLSQLETATAALDVTKDKPSSDLFYNGDIAQWKKLGYSLMLKAAMRLTKVDPATAQKYAEKAYAGGTMASIADNAKVKADNANGNSNSDVNALLVKDDFREVRWSNTLISYMQSTSDPRVSAVAEISAGTGKAANEVQGPGINTAALQVGLPNGYDLNGGTTDVSKAPGYPGATPADPTVKDDVAAPVGKYSRPRFAVYDDRSRINMLYTYGESELLLAEAASRGWATGSAATHYANALAADIATIAQFSDAGAVPAGTITTYVAAHPLVAATALQQINMEYFVVTSTTFNFNETWANWRRSGFPVLTPVKYVGQFTDGSIPRRNPYPLGLPSTNAANYADAVSRLSGGDVFTARVWWDK
ncbi:SusD/RagB family nutrient-binding outer membrane lipoprotein [Mucilaginibacter sp. ZT4R22]|uniref:SusD/RagB family nutrient-binding outer membrane lipoprotein n=1 Tax=Mucilaginibacter pankratovii TaxID=2772110 RepID=A0ABR7WX92_9SPHI|nr:SusD/RagB family nutrient-binding outer membrane lipoprotein [Mucilaginibacter pankratovii]MBD1366813.1 SusD/RagB family nutrient-binding outer membrane lipoprotein [Mucilaginibacter pankratovii]